MFYLNGDNDLTHEVLYTLDMLETVGSSDDINILALVDGRSGSYHGYGQNWEGAKFLYVTHDPVIGEINSHVLDDLGEQNLGNPDTLEAFVTRSLEYVAERYIFCTFAHGRGIIDTKILSMPGPHKSLTISVDETDNSQLTLQEFSRALKNALDGRKFDSMVLFTCLSNMVEIGYGLRDITKYIIGSEDEIRIVNNPPGTFQIRGIKFEEPLKAMRSNPKLSILDFGKITIDTFIDQYEHDIQVNGSNGQPYYRRYPAGMALIDCGAFDKLVAGLDRLAKYVIGRIHRGRNTQELLNEIQSTLSKTQRYSSFLNLEYYDLQDFLKRLAAKTQDNHLKLLCNKLSDYTRTKVVIYERHTADCASNGLSIYLSNAIIPDNIFKSHQALYQRSAFGKDTAWDEMIASLRNGLQLDHN